MKTNWFGVGSHMLTSVSVSLFCFLNASKSFCGRSWSSTWGRVALECHPIRSLSGDRLHAPSMGLNSMSGESCMAAFWQFEQCTLLVHCSEETEG